MDGGEGQAKGIIPARAGFTDGGVPRMGIFRDHPRSRGVYGKRCEATFNRLGSSPLARGLRRGPDARRSGIGIIPARAGFTPPRLCGMMWSADHPRSRGVYLGQVVDDPGDAGSSPLARGLRRGRRRRPQRRRIIPARAGFTMMHSTQTHSCADHPRSRGVYGSHGVGVLHITGSSPLARGLLGLDSVSCAPTRIIPARAGFTITVGRY